jgi:hypothetical protein
MQCQCCCPPPASVVTSGGEEASGGSAMGAAGGFQVPCRRARLVRLMLGEVPCVWRLIAFLGELCAG